MTTFPNSKTTHEVWRTGPLSYETVGYFANGDEAREFARANPGTKAMIYLAPCPLPDWCGHCDGGIVEGEFCVCRLGRQAQADDSESAEPAASDPLCVCGVYRSEHALCGCGEWERRR